MPQAFPLGISSPLFLNQNGFVSAQVARAGGVATALWAVGTAGVNPAAGRTAGLSVPSCARREFESHLGASVDSEAIDVVDFVGFRS